MCHRHIRLLDMWRASFPQSISSITPGFGSATSPIWSPVLSFALCFDVADMSTFSGEVQVVATESNLFLRKTNCIHFKKAFIRLC